MQSVVKLLNTSCVGQPPVYKKIIDMMSFDISEIYMAYVDSCSSAWTHILYHLQIQKILFIKMMNSASSDTDPCGAPIAMLMSISFLAFSVAVYN